MERLRAYGRQDPRNRYYRQTPPQIEMSFPVSRFVGVATPDPVEISLRVKWIDAIPTVRAVDQ
jgi:hypothetical protein